MIFLHKFQLFLTLNILLFSFNLFSADIQYSFLLNKSAIPSDVFMRKITLKVHLGNCSSCTAEVDGQTVTATYSATTKLCTFNVDNNNASVVVVTGINYTGGATGAVTKATLYNDKKWAYSFTFDDSYDTQYTVAYPVFQSKGYRGGIAVITNTIDSGGSYMTGAHLDALYAAGWSIFNHTVAHVDDGTGGYSGIRCSGSPHTIFTQILPAKQWIENRYPGYINTYYVYPYNDMNYKSCLMDQNWFLGAESIVGDNYVDTFPNTDARYELKRQQFYGTALSTFNGWADNAANDTRPRWLIAFTHGVQPGTQTPSTYNTNEATLLSHINYIYNTYGEGSTRKDMWFAPSDEVLMYLFTRQYLTVTPYNLPTSTPTPTGTWYTSTPTNTGTFTVTSTGTFTNTATATATETPCGWTILYRVNCGGTQYVDTQGFTWAADKAWTTGTWGYVGGNTANTTNPINGTSDDTLYQTERYGSSTYRFTVANGNYRVRLLYAEFYCTQPNCRIFSVRAEGTTIISNLDIYAKVGYCVAYEEVHNVTVSDGELTLEGITGSADEPKWSAIEIIQINSCSPTITSTNTRTNTMTSTVTNTNTRTFTLTYTMTATRTNTVTFTDSPTSTGTHTNTAISTRTNTATVTRTPTETVTGTQPATWTYTETPTNTTTFTYTVTITFTDSSTPTETYTNTATSTRTNTMTITRTPTETVTGTQPTTWTYTETTTYTSTFTYTNTITSTNSFTPTGTHTNTGTSTGTDTMTVTRTQTGTMTGTQMPTFTYTNTFTYTVTFTNTTANTNTPTATHTPKISDVLDFVKMMPIITYPNPANAQSDLKIKFFITKTADKIEIKLYTIGFRLIKEISKEINLQAGENNITIENQFLKEVAKGIYYYVIIIEDNKGKKITSKIQKFMIL